MMWDNGDYWSHGMFGGGLLMFVGLILGTVLIVWFVLFLVRQTANPTGSGPGTATAAQVPPSQPSVRETPREILMRRYASGDIDREEYLKRLGDL